MANLKIAWMAVVIQAAVLVYADREGVLMFLSSGANVTFADLWVDANLTVTQEDFGYRWSRKDMIEQGTIFRSPLIDRLSELDLQNLTLRLINADGETIRQYELSLVTHDEFLTQDFHVEIDPEYGPSLVIESTESTKNISLIILHLDSMAKSQGGERIIFYNRRGLFYMTGALPDADYRGCYKVSSLPDNLDDLVTVEQVYECAIHCLQGQDGQWFGIFTYDNNTSSYPKCLCMYEDNYDSSDRCSALCDDGNTCGEEITNPSPSYAGLDVYSRSIYNEVLTKAVSPSTYYIGFEVGPFNWKIRFNYPMIVTGVLLSSKIIINPVTPTNFTMSKSMKDCSSTGFNSLTDKIIMGADMGNVTIFETETMETFAQIEAWCLFFDKPGIQDQFYEANITVVSEKFLLADHIEVIGRWTEQECFYAEAMEDVNLIPDSSIHVEYFPSLTTYRNPAVAIVVPATAFAKVKVVFPSFDEEFWVRSAFVSSSSDNVLIKSAKVMTKRNCTDQGDGSIGDTVIDKDIEIDSPTYHFNSLTSNTLDKFCAQKITMTIVLNNSSTASDVFDIKLRVDGCRISPGSQTAATCITTDLLLDASVSVTHTLEHRSKEVSNLRSFGNGIVILNNMHITVQIDLSHKAAIEVRKVMVKGLLSGAEVTTDDYTAVQMQNTTVGLEFKPTAVSWTKTILITTVPYSGHVTGYTSGVTVLVEACILLERGNATAGSTLTTPSTTSTTISTTTSNTTLPSNTTSTPNTSLSNTTSTQNTTSSSNTTSTSNTTSQSNTTSTQNTTLPSNTTSTPNTSLSNTTSTQNTTSSSNTTSTSNTTSQSNTTSTQNTTSSSNTTSTSNTTSQSNTTSTPNVTTTTTTTQTTATSNTTPSFVDPNAMNPNAPTSPTNTTSTSSTIPTTETTASDTQPPAPTTETTPTTSATNSQTSSSSASTSVTSTTTTYPTCLAACVSLCSSTAPNTTIEEIQQLVEELVRHLTVPKEETSNFKRTKISAEDHRTSSRVVGSGAIVVMVIGGVLFVAMDAPFFFFIGQKMVTFVKTCMTSP